jgi:hypothetical protein
MSSELFKKLIISNKIYIYSFNQKRELHLEERGAGRNYRSSPLCWGLTHLKKFKNRYHPLNELQFRLPSRLQLHLPLIQMHLRPILHPRLFQELQAQILLELMLRLRQRLRLHQQLPLHRPQTI